MKRVSVVGKSGSGKTTFGRALAARLGVPYVEMDALHHGPNWTEASAAELTERVTAAMDASEGWVVDGNYHRKVGDAVLERADTVVWLDLPLPLVLARLARRTLGRIARREELWNGNRETIRNTFFARESLFAWTVRSHFRHQGDFPARFARHPQLRVYHLRTPREAAAFLARLPERHDVRDGLLPGEVAP